MPISILIPAYNEERYLAEAIDSVLAQTYRDFELIILDDGSKDRTLEIAQSYAQRDSRIRVESHANVGVGPTMNRGFSMCSNEWVAILQADDVMMPMRFERQFAFLAEHPELDVAAGWCKHIDGEGKVIGKGDTPLTTHEAVNQIYAANELIAFNCSTAIVRKSAVLAVGGYRPQFRVNEDADLWVRMLEKGYKILIQPEYFVKYRIHAGSVSVARARFIRQQARWVKDCMIRRRRGESELSWEDFVAMRKSLPWLVRLDAERRDTAKVLYKTATYQFAQKKYYQVLPTVLASMMLEPGYTIRQITSKLSFRRS
jgi:glycosyltransferase involved in cell wall biosynthesis